MLALVPMRLLHRRLEGRTPSTKGLWAFCSLVNEIERPSWRLVLIILRMIRSMSFNNYKNVNSIDIVFSVPGVAVFPATFCTLKRSTCFETKGYSIAWLGLTCYLFKRRLQLFLFPSPSPRISEVSSSWHNIENARLKQDQLHENCVMARKKSINLTMVFQFLWKPMTDNRHVLIVQYLFPNYSN